MKTLRFVAVLAAALLVLAPAAVAQSGEKVMTEKELSKFIQDWPAVYSWFGERSKKIAAGPDGSVAAALFLDKDFSAFIGKRGWTVERFSYVTGVSLSLLSVVAIERKNPEIAAQFDEAIAQIEASELSPAEKAENVKAMNEAKKGMLAISSDKDFNQAELKLVRARFDELMKLVEKLQRAP
jgi:hypothetical protein